jgi:hypothetical protein
VVGNKTSATVTTVMRAGHVETIEDDLGSCLEEAAKADAAIAAMPSLEAPGEGHGRHSARC